jgi:fucose permease
METALTVSAFLGAAFVGLAGDARIGGYLDKRRWLRIVAFAVVFLVIAAILTGGPDQP